MNQLIFEEIKDPSELSGDVIQVLGSQPGKLLRFRNAALARAETNKNHDQILASELPNLAATLPLMPIDLEHRETDIVGFYVNAHVDGDALLTDGVIYASRFPQVAKDLARQAYKFSIEASADKAECSMCHSVFASEREYCEHLSNRVSSGATRILYGLKATGGGITRNPAGTATHADPNQMEFIAHVVLASDTYPVISFASELEYRIWTKKPDAMAKVLDAGDRAELKDSDFALIQKSNGKTLRRFPINDCAHAQNALARLNQAHNLDAEEKAQVRKKAQAKLASSECAKSNRAKSAVAAYLFAEWANTPTESFVNTATPVVSPLLYVVTEPDFVKNLPTANAQPTTFEQTVAQVQKQSGVTASTATTDSTKRMGVLLSEPEPAQPADRKLTVHWK